MKSDNSELYDDIVDFVAEEIDEAAAEFMARVFFLYQIKRKIDEIDNPEKKYTIGDMWIAPDGYLHTLCVVGDMKVNFIDYERNTCWLPEPFIWESTCNFSETDIRNMLGSDYPNFEYFGRHE